MAQSSERQDLRKKFWAPLSEVMFRQAIAFPGQPTSLLVRGVGFEHITSLDAEMHLRVVRVESKRWGRFTVPFEAVAYFKHAMVAANTNDSGKAG